MTNKRKTERVIVDGRVMYLRKGWRERGKKKQRIKQRIIVNSWDEVLTAEELLIKNNTIFTIQIGNPSHIIHPARSCGEYQIWKKAVFERDNFTCQKCGSKKHIHAHHIKRFVDIIKENNIQTIEQALRCHELWDVSNGQTLCKKCHRCIKYTTIQ